MIKLEELHGDKGARQKRKRVGRGESSGQGKTSGKGHKGAQARTGTPKGKSFEGGQTPLTRRLPKRGFNRTNWQTPVQIINLDQLNRFEDGAQVDFAGLVEAGLVSSKTPLVKILAKGELQKKNLSVTADAFSKTAREKIEASGGKCLGAVLVEEAPAPPVKRKSSAKSQESAVESVSEPAATAEPAESAEPTPKHKQAKAKPAEEAAEEKPTAKKKKAKPVEEAAEEVAEEKPAAKKKKAKETE